MVKFATKKPAFSTLAFSLSKSTSALGLKLTRKDDVFIFASTLSTKSNDFNALKIALLHILQVNPLACIDTSFTCACTAYEKRTKNMIIKFFIMSIFKKI